jgi:hypothetical protein
VRQLSESTSLSIKTNHPTTSYSSLNVNDHVPDKELEMQNGEADCKTIAEVRATTRADKAEAQNKDLSQNHLLLFIGWSPVDIQTAQFG